MSEAQRAETGEAATVAEKTVEGRDRKRIVVKVGSNTLTGDADRLSRPVMLEIVRQMAKLLEAGHQVALVSSGAIVAGREALRTPDDAGDIQLKQVLAAVGQARLMQMWDQLFSHYGVVVAQTLMTRADLADRLRHLNARNTLLALLDRRVVPVVNENDVVAIEEIKIGDNDNLSGLVANLVDADLLVMLTDTGGLYTADPRLNPSARLIAEVPTITEAIEQLASGAGTTRGTGGMLTKVQAARLATAAGATVVIADGRVEGVLARIVAGESVGTRFMRTTTRHESRKRWILSGLVGTAAVQIDEGAGAALAQGRSILPVGVISVQGRFGRGDSVSVIGADGRATGCGVVNYAAGDLVRIKGCRSAQIQAVLGYHYGDEVIHRNNLIVL